MPDLLMLVFRAGWGLLDFLLLGLAASPMDRLERWNIRRRPLSETDRLRQARQPSPAPAKARPETTCAFIKSKGEGGELEADSKDRLSPT